MTQLIIARAWSSDAYLPSPSEFQQIVDNCLIHRPWFDDSLWEASEREKRDAIIGHLSTAYNTGRVWSVLTKDRCVGLFLLERVRPGRDAYAHFIFFDRKLRDKLHLCRETLRDSFERFNLQAVRVEVPTYASQLANYLRDALGFKFEGEWVGVPTDVAWRASRRVRAMIHKGSSHDLLLLSLMREALHGTAGHKDGHDASTGAQKPSD